MLASSLTLAHLIDLFLQDCNRRVQSDEIAPATATYYRSILPKALRRLPSDLLASDLKPLCLVQAKLTAWHQVQALQRLCNWAVDLEILPANPIKRMKKVTPPGRSRVLLPSEWSELLAAAKPSLGALLKFQRATACRPGEARAACWRDYSADRAIIMLRDHKTKRRTAVQKPRVIVLNAEAKRIIESIAATNERTASKAIFLNTRGAPWSSSALRTAVRRACQRAGIVDGEERIVAYSIRHTAATAATAAGVRDRQLADLMGHVSTRTTARYQHLDIEHLRAAAEKISA